MRSSRGTKLPLIRFDDLPLFATDEELGTAIVGPERAKHWAGVTVKILERMPGFPRFDPEHGGRYSLGVKRFYEAQHCSEPGQRPRVQDGQEDPSAWRDRKSRRRA